MLTFGVRAHDFGRFDNVEELAKRIQKKGFTSIQLALNKVFKWIDSDIGKINTGMADHIRKTLEKHDISVAVLGCYGNIVHPDREVRRKNIGRFKEHIRFVRDFGCSIVATETFSITDKNDDAENRSEKAFKIVVESVEELVKEAEKFGVFVCIEGVSSHVISTCEKIKRLMDSIQSNNLQVLFDPINLLNIKNYAKQDKIINQAFELFGDKIAIIHAKDFNVVNNKFQNVQIGKGTFNYNLLLKHLKNKKPYINVLFEDQTSDDMKESIKTIKNIYDSIE